MDDSLVVDVLITGSGGGSLRRDLLNCRLKFTKAVAPVSKRNLRSNEKQQNREEDLTFHSGVPRSADILVGGSRASLLHLQGRNRQ